MYLVIGNEYCNNCDTVKTILHNRGIEFEYVLFDSLSSEEQDKYRDMAIKANKLSMPIIIKDEKIISIQEAI